jgi:hypothetical protein
MSLAISNPNSAKFLSINERASLRCADTACKEIELIPRHTIQELYENNHKTVTAGNPTYSANSVSLYNKIADQTCLDIIKMPESEGFALSKHAIQCWIYPLIRSIEKEHVARTKHAVIAPPDR